MVPPLQTREAQHWVPVFFSLVTTFPKKLGHDSWCLGVGGLEEEVLEGQRWAAIVELYSGHSLCMDVLQKAEAVTAVHTRIFSTDLPAEQDNGIGVDSKARLTQLSVFMHMH